MFDLKELAVALSSILLIGTLADLLIINDEWEKIKSRLFDKSLKIKSSSINELIFVIANKVFSLLNRTGKVSFSYTDDKYSKSKFALIWLGFLCFGLLVLYFVFFDFSYLSSLVLVVPLLSLSIIWFLLIFSYEVVFGKWSHRGDNAWRIFSKTSLISAAITYLAILLGSALYLNFGVSEFWFQSAKEMNSGVLEYSEIMGLINYPFDFLSLAFTYLCLKMIVERKMYYPLLPLFDMAFSIILSCVLYIILFSLSEGTLRFASLINDLQGLFLNGPEKTQFDLIYLLPIILSTFIPISLLGILILGLVFYKFVSLLFARVLHVLSEKQGSIFKDIALTISAFLALVNSFIAIGAST